MRDEQRGGVELGRKIPRRDAGLFLFVFLGLLASGSSADAAEDPNRLECHATASERSSNERSSNERSSNDDLSGTCAEPSEQAIVAPSSDRGLLSTVGASRSERSWRVFLSPRLAFDKGSLPGPGFGVGGALGATFGAQRLSLGLLVWPALGASIETSGLAEARFSLLASTLEDCVRLSSGPYALDLCAGIEIGRIHAERIGDANPNTTSSLWVSPEGGLAPSYKLGDRLRLRGAFGSVLPLVRPEFRFRDAGGETIHRTSWVAMRSSIEIEVNY